MTSDATVHIVDDDEGSRELLSRWQTLRSVSRLRPAESLEGVLCSQNVPDLECGILERAGSLLAGDAAAGAKRAHARMGL